MFLVYNEGVFTVAVFEAGELYEPSSICFATAAAGQCSHVRDMEETFLEKRSSGTTKTLVLALQRWLCFT